jgi:hypothetical protein
MTQESASEVRSRHVEAMGPELGGLYHALWQEVAWLHMKWLDYRALFASSRGRVDLFNRTAPSFFGHLEGVLWEDILLHLSRLTDTPASRGKANLTLTRLPDAIDVPALQAKVALLVEQTVADAAFARDWRNRRLAHRELKIGTGEAARPLAPASRERLEKALKAIRDAMNAVELHYRDSTVMYEGVIQARGGVDALVSVLEVADGVERDQRLAIRRALRTSSGTPEA